MYPIAMKYIYESNTPPIVIAAVNYIHNCVTGLQGRTFTNTYITVMFAYKNPEFPICLSYINLTTGTFEAFHETRRAVNETTDGKTFVVVKISEKKHFQHKMTLFTMPTRELTSRSL